MQKARHLFTSESVTMGHPDKVADQVSDAVLDAVYTQDPNGRVACETLVTTGMVMVAGEITTTAQIDYPTVVRETVREIGYTDARMGFDCETCGVLVAMDKQSPDISQGVSEGEGLHKEQGAGDQGLMFGYACSETPEFMPMPIALAHRLVEQLALLRREGRVPYLRPDGKSQVTVEYENNKPKRVHTVVISTQHDPDVDYETIRSDMIEKCISAVIDRNMLDDNTVYHINPTGRFVTGGPHGDCGITGRKIIVDTYGGRGSHGGGAFSGKDPSKVDRTASYMARHVAKNVVAAGLADQCEIQLSYAIGVAEPISVLVDTEASAKVDEDKLSAAIVELFPLTPSAMIEYLDLRRPIFKETARHGHFGRNHPDFTWEKIHRVDELRKALGV